MCINDHMGSEVIVFVQNECIPEYKEIKGIRVVAIPNGIIELSSFRKKVKFDCGNFIKSIVVIPTNDLEKRMYNIEDICAYFLKKREVIYYNQYGETKKRRIYKNRSLRLRIEELKKHYRLLIDKVLYLVYGKMGW